MWGIPLIIEQVKDKERLLSSTALDILLEACYDHVYLEEVVSIWPHEILMHAGDLGKLIIAKFYSIPRGLNHTKANIKDLLNDWIDVFNKKYVLMIEADMHSSLALYSKNDEKSFFKRTCSTRSSGLSPNVLPHLFGQLSQTTQGISILKNYGKLESYVQTLNSTNCKNENTCLLVKTALWICGHTSTSGHGVQLLLKINPNIFSSVIKIATTNQVYSLRATALNVLGLISSTKYGVDVLEPLGWVGVRLDRNTSWPIQDEENQFWSGKQRDKMFAQRVHISYVNKTKLKMDNKIKKQETPVFEKRNWTTQTVVQQVPTTSIIFKSNQNSHVRSLSESMKFDNCNAKIPKPTKQRLYSESITKQTER